METLQQARIDELVIQHQGYLRSLARNIAKGLPQRVEFEDLIGYGQVGLLEAARRFEDGHGTLFTTFAYYRIRGAIFDGLRKLAGVPHASLAGSAGADDLLEHSGAESEDADALATQLADVVERTATALLLSESAVALDDHAPHVPLEERELAQRVRAAVSTLSESDRALLHELYFESKSMTDVALALGRHKATVSRSHARVIDALRRLLGLGEDLA